MLATVCEVCAEGRSAMDAGNVNPDSEMGSVVVSLAPALKKMTQLTALDLRGARIRFGLAPGGSGGSNLWWVLWGTCLDARRCGWGTRLRAGDACDGMRGVC
jgi:hypothetical protein